ncbi:MAG TPA: DUF1843 domain-containing protein, partial [Actinomycetota bacterium]|nr:DUF1843 domain-containing protein [Actinomycetota bacterium]
MTIPPYGVAIREAVTKGDLEEMRRVADAAEEHLKETGDIAAALELLKTEIAKAE